MTAPSARPPATPARDTWLLQGVAAATAGCSVSAIRKWRRLGLVADRTRISPGGMRRVEVRLEDVLARMQASMTPPARGADRVDPAGEAAQAAVAVVPLGELDVFVQRIADAERRAAQADARSRAKDAVVEFLRERVADLEGQVHTPSGAPDRGVDSPSRPPLDPGPLIAEIRRLRALFQAARNARTSQDIERRNAIRNTYDAALICLCLAAGLPTTTKLGEALTGPERTRLAHALLEAGFDIVG